MAWNTHNTLGYSVDTVLWLCPSQLMVYIYIYIWVILLKIGPKMVPFPDEIKIKLKHETF